MEQPIPFNAYQEGTRLTNRQLYNKFEYLKDSRYWAVRKVRMEEGKLPGEVCLYYTVTPFGRDVICILGKGK